MTTKRTRQVSKVEVPGSRRVLVTHDAVTVTEMQYLVTVQEIVFHDAPIPEPEPTPTPTPTPARSVGNIFSARWNEPAPPLTDFTMTGRTGLSLSRAISISGTHNLVNSETARADVIEFQGRKVVCLRVNSKPAQSTAIRLALIKGNADYSALKSYAGQTVFGRWYVYWPAAPVFGASGSWFGTAQTKTDTNGKPSTWQAYETNGIGVDELGRPKLKHQMNYTAGANVTREVNERALWPHQEWVRIDWACQQDRANPLMEWSMNGALVARFRGAGLLTTDGYCKVYPIMLYGDDFALGEPVELYLGDVDISTEPLR